MFTIHDSDRELADYMVFNESKKRGQSVIKNFEEYPFFEKETKPDSMKCEFKPNKTLTATREIKHDVTTSDGRKIHKKVASNPLEDQPSKKTEETKKPTKR